MSNEHDHYEDGKVCRPGMTLRDKNLADDRTYRIADQFAEDFIRSWGRSTDNFDEYILDDDPTLTEIGRDCLGHVEWRRIAFVTQLDDHHILVMFTDVL